MQSDSFKIKGELWVDFNGEITHYNNLVVNAGKNLMTTSTFTTLPASLFNYVAVGTSGALPTPGDTALGGEIGRVLTTPTVVANQATLVASFPPGVATGNIQEAGVFNAASGGTMLSHVNVGPYNKAASDALTITWQFTVG